MKSINLFSVKSETIWQTVESVVYILHLSSCSNHILWNHPMWISSSHAYPPMYAIVLCNKVIVVAIRTINTWWDATSSCSSITTSSAMCTKLVLQNDSENRIREKKRSKCMHVMDTFQMDYSVNTSVKTVITVNKLTCAIAHYELSRKLISSEIEK